MADHDWADTPLGERSGWPAFLSTTLDLMLESPLPTMLIWGHERLLFCNDAFVAVAGARFARGLCEPLATVSPDLAKLSQDALQRGHRDGEATVLRRQHLDVSRDGEPTDLWFDLFYTPLRDTDGQSAGVLGTLIDITDQVAFANLAADNDRRLAASESRLNMLFNQASVGIVQSTLQGRLVSVNQRFCSILGRSAQELIGSSIEEITHPDDRDASRALQAELLTSGRPFTAEKRLLRSDGSGVWVSNHVSLARDAEGRPDFVIRIVQDISDRKEAETLAQESSERIELALGAGAILGTWVWEVAIDRVTGDDRFAKSFSVTPERARSGFPIAEALGSIHPEDVRTVEAAVDTSLRGGGPFRAEYRLKQPDGTWQWVEANGHCEHDARGKPTRFPGVLINIGHRRSAAERQAFLIMLGDLLRTIDKPESVVVKSAEATGRHLRGALVGYGEVSADGRWVDLIAGVAEGGILPAERLPATAFGAAAEDALRHGMPWLGAELPIKKGEVQFGPVLAVPLFRDQRWHAVMFVAAGKDRIWTEAEADLLREVVGRTWDATERARAVITLRRAQSRQAFLLRLNDHLSEIHDPREVTEIVAESIGSYLEAGHAAYAEFDLREGQILLDGGWSATDRPNVAGAFSFRGVLDAEVAQLVRGLTVSEEDFRRRDPINDQLAEALDRTKVRAALAIPLIRDGQLRAALVVAQSEPRRWTLEEISLTQEVARRTWDALERTRAEAALQRSEANLRAMFDTLPVGILFAEFPSGRVTEANTRVEEILGYAAGQGAAEAAYGDWIAFDEDGRQVPIEDHPLFVAVTTGDTATRVFHHQRGDGTRVWVSIVGAPVRDTEGRITGGLVTVVDIDREKRAEAALRELNATLEQQVALRTRERDRIWRNSPDLLAVMALDGTLQAVNPSWTTLLGWSMNDLVGQRSDRFIHPQDAGATASALDSLSRGPLAQPFENRYRDKDGAYRWFSWTASTEGDIVYANGRDVTAEKEQAHALRQAEEQLRQSQKMEAVGQLTGGIAHDFNNLLTGITGALDLLAKRIEQGRLDSTSRYIDMAMNSANRAASLTHRLLAFSRRQPLEAKAVEVNKLVGSMDDLLRRTLGERIELEIKTRADLWPTLCDPHQLENALLNLVINARDAMPDGGRLTIETSNVSFETAADAREAGARPGSYLMLAVADTGQGMSPAVMARAFDPFFTTKPIGQGTGLGLSMIYGFAKQSEGTVRIASEVGVGTTVRLYLPRYRGEIAEDEATRPTPPRAEDGETVLIVEDDPTVRTLVLEVLRDLGYRTLEAEDGPSGLRVIESTNHIDLLVTDVGLPGINGRQLADRARETRPKLKILFITGYAENATFGTGQLDPDMQMITKPFQVDVLATRIREMIEQPQR